MRRPVVLAAVALAAAVVPACAAEGSPASLEHANGGSASGPEAAVQSPTLAKRERDLSAVARRPVRVVYPSPYAPGRSASP